MLLRVLVGLLVISALAKAGCPPGFMLSQGNCYKIMTTPKPWKESQAACDASGGYLAALLNQRDQFAIDSIAEQLANFSQCQVGGVYESWVGGLFCDDQSFWYSRATKPRFDPNACNVPFFCNDKFANWADDQPTYDNKHCISLRRDGEWQSTSCGESLCSICQSKQV